MNYLAKLAAGTAMLVAMTAPAMAEELRSGNTYLRLSGGALVMDDIKMSGGGLTGELSFDTGWVVSGAIGYNLSPQFAVEAELTYLTADFDTASVAGVGSAPVDGDLSSFLTMVNANFHPMAGGSFDPYIGAGIGMAFSEVSIDSVGGAPLNRSADSEDLALQANAGFDMNLGNGKKVGAQYRYIWTDTGTSGMDDITGHALTLNFTTTF